MDAHLRSPGRFLWWLVASQPVRVARAAVLASIWLIGLATPPYLLSRAIDDGLKVDDYPVLVRWTIVLFLIGALNAGIGVLRHRTMTWIRLDGALRTIRVVVEQAIRLGASLSRQVTAGEVVTIGISDVWTIATVLTVTGPGIGSAVAYLVIAVLLFRISPLIAIVVLAGVPLLAVTIGPLLGRLRKAGDRYREEQGLLTERLVDIIGGLRVLGGLGGKERYADRYRQGSASLRAEGYRVGAVTSWIQALGVGLPAVFLAVVTWLAARMAAEGSISIGDLVAVYGYVAVLVVPVAFFIECGSDISRGLVSAARVVRFLRLGPDTAGGMTDAPATPSILADPDSGVRVEPGLLTALAAARTADVITIVDRLGGLAGPGTHEPARWGGVCLDVVDTPQVRARILVADNEADLFAGPLRDVVSGRRDADDVSIRRAIHAAMADDILQGLPDGLDSVIDGQGRNLSGGQRQRIRLARALLADPEVLLAIEPTSAVDALTEAGMADRLASARAGRTTVVTSTSPLLLDRADVVHYLEDGVSVASGTHRELLDDHPGYRALLSRSTSEPVDREPVDGETVDGETVDGETVRSDEEAVR